MYDSGGGQGTRLASCCNSTVQGRRAARQYRAAALARQALAPGLSCSGRGVRALSGAGVEERPRPGRYIALRARLQQPAHGRGPQGPCWLCQLRPAPTPPTPPPVKFFVARTEHSRRLSQLMLVVVLARRRLPRPTASTILPASLRAGTGRRRRRCIAAAAPAARTLDVETRRLDALHSGTACMA